MVRESVEMDYVRGEKMKQGDAGAIPLSESDGCRLDADRDEETERRRDGNVSRRNNRIGEAHARMGDVLGPASASDASTSRIRGDIIKVRASCA